MVSVLVSFIISCVAGLVSAPFIIRQLKKLKLGQFIRDDGPQTHLVKQGTPSMGGMIMALGTLVAVALSVPKSDDVYMALVTALGFGGIGFVDDYLKVRHRRSLGLKGRFKFLGQLLFGAAIAFYAYRAYGGDVKIPFVGLPIGMGPFYVPFAMFIVIGAANGMNFADGVDGLAAGAASASVGAYGIIAFLQMQEGLAALSAGVIGSCMAFLAFNSHPAKVFMGDTGSLGLGGLLGALAVLTRNEALLAVIGFLYVVEVLSSVIQVYYIRRLKRRLFRMAPIHHHFELMGFPEAHVAVGFWIASFISGALGLLIFLRG
ncbi:MAG TPA: phospho-N-acetylmuramoyl-pentapeptide-transferase [Bacillota bacterium]|nr:phospho-N-acetylmuramoyl-pentapeptide-transferase [Bacillota bacterium]